MSRSLKFLLKFLRTGMKIALNFIKRNLPSERCHATPAETRGCFLRGRPFRGAGPGCNWGFRSDPRGLRAAARKVKTGMPWVAQAT